MPHRRVARFVAIAGPIIVSGVVGLVALRGLRVAEDARVRAARGRQVVNALARVLARTLEAEAAGRGYALTGDSSFLVPYRGARDDVRSSILEAAEAADADQTQAARLRALQDVEDECFRMFDAAIAARRAQPNFNAADSAGIARMARAEGARVDSIRVLYAALSGPNRQRLAARTAEELTEDSRVRVIVMAGVVLITLLSLAANLMLQQSERAELQAVEARERANRDLENVNADLEKHAAAVNEHAQALDSERSRLITVLEQSPLAIAIAEAPSGRLILSNRLVSEVLGLTRPPDESGNWRARMKGVHPDGRPYEPNEWPLARALDHAEVVIGEMIAIERGDGARRIISVNAAPVRDAEGNVDAAVAIFSDVTDAQRAAEILRQARHEAEVASRSKSEFLAVVSHELRTPLTAVMGYAELLADGITGPVSPAQREQLLRIMTSSQHLLRLIEDILTMSRMEAGREEATPEPMSVAQALHEAAGLAAPLAAAKGLVLHAEPVPEQLMMRADPVRYRQILLNLLSNAVKFTDHGAITLSAFELEGCVAVDVRDDGVGIDAADLERIFDPFWQAEQQNTRRVGGTGLGLSVTRRLARLMGGEVTVESVAGKGSLFRVWMPGVDEKGVDGDGVRDAWRAAGRESGVASRKHAGRALDDRGEMTR